MTWASGTALFYGLLMIAGGTIAFRRVKSTPSLIGGLVVGAFCILGAFAMFAGSASGRGIALLGTMLAVLFFGWSLSRGILEEEKKVARPVILLALSVLETGVLLWGG